MPTILITGCSSGFGLEIARHFLDRDWNVIATMRTPREDVLPPSPKLRILPLDVTDAASIDAAVSEAGEIDVLVNNAGIGWLGPLEGTSDAMMREVFETNTFGTFALTRAFLPQFRQRRSGVIVNVSSTVTLRALPLLPIYTASKAAVNALTECLALELEQFDIRVRLVLPGRAPGTRFGENAMPRVQAALPQAYGALAQQVFAGFSEDGEITRSEDVAQAVWRAVVDPASPARIAAGADAVALAQATGGADV